MHKTRIRHNFMHKNTAASENIPEPQKEVLIWGGSADFCVK